MLQIIVFGRSLGGAVAFHVAATNPGKINSLIVENTFWSIEAVTGKVSEECSSTQVSRVVFWLPTNVLLSCSFTTLSQDMSMADRSALSVRVDQRFRLLHQVAYCSKHGG